MRPERWREIENLYHQARALEGGERTAFLDRACSGDQPLRQELESLLAFESQAENFIESPAVEVAATMLKDQAHSRIGNNIGPYQVLSLIGAGGMGEVYLAQDSRLGRKIALKVLPSEFTRDSDRLRRFEQEARAASALNHPNILTIFEIGHDPEAHYIATEYIQGETLRRLGQVTIELPKALDIACQIASALSAAHEAGIVHRDIKPENLMLRPDGYVKVLDFGIAKLTERYDAPLSSEAQTAVDISTETGVVLGTTSYMSPEQARGLELDARSDLFSLGVVLYEMICGTTPFKGPTGADVLAAILVHEAPPPSAFNSRIPEALDRIISTALCKDRDERYQDAQSLLGDLRSLKQRMEFENELERSTGGKQESGPARQEDRYSIEPPKIIYSLAILPLTNTLADPGMDYFSDGVTESIINSLAALNDLQVMAWSTVSGYKNRQIDPRTVGRELGVHSVLTGRVLQRGEKLVIKTELINASTGSLLWGESYSCDPGDIFRIEEEISKEISEKLLLRLTTEERKRLTKRFTDNTDAYHAYLKGRYFWNKRTDEDVRQGIEYFKQAIETDPSYALAYAGLADSYIILGSFGVATMPSGEACPKAREAASRALEIDGTLAEAHASLGYCLAIYYWDWSAAERAFKRSLELKPGYSTAHHWYGFVHLVAKGLLAEAILEETRAGELDPLSLTISANLGLLMYLERRYDKAISQFLKTLEMDRNFAYAHWQLGLAYEQKSMYDEAISRFKTASALAGRSTLPMALLGHAYAVSGRKDEAISIVDELISSSSRRHVSPYRLAAIFAGLGDKRNAFDWLGRAFEQRDPWLIWLQHDPVLDPIRSDRRFKTLVRRIGLDAASRPEQAGAKHKIAKSSQMTARIKRPTRKTITSLAIMPLVNISGDPEMEYLGDGITETIINTLSQLPKIRVTARSTVFRYKGKDADPQAAGHELGVQAVLTGRIRQTEDSLMIAVELIDVRGDSQLWGEHYNRKRADIFDIQGEIAREITEKLRLKLNRSEKTRIARQYTANVEAYHAYLKGRHLWNKRTAESLRRGIEYFKQAIDRDPSFASAYAGLSDSHTLLVVREALPPDEGYAKAKAAARKALEIDEDLAEAHASLGHAMLHNWEWEEGERELRKAIELNPRYPSAHHWYSEHLTAMGRCDESIRELKLAAELDPLSLVISADLGRAFYYSREYDRVIEQEARTLELDSSFWLSYINLGRSYTQKGMHAEAIEKLELASRLSVGNTEALAFLAFAYAAAGKRDSALKMLVELDQQARQSHVPSYHYAVAHAGLGDNNRAFEWLERAFDKHSVDLFTLKVEPMFDGLRSDPRFHSLLTRVGLLPVTSEQRPGSLPVPAGIAILPFKPIHPEHRDEYLELGIADALITKLSDIKQIVVRPTSSVRKYTGLDLDSVTVGREMAVESVLEGWIQKQADRIRVTVRLVRVEDGRSLWTGKFDEDFTDIFAVEDSISEKVAAALALRLTSDERERLRKRYTDNTAAYNVYLKGRFYWNKRTEESLKKAVECFNQATEIDPDYALSYAGLADCYTKLGDVGVTAMTPREAFARARQAALKALEIDTSLAEVHASLGHLDMHLLRWVDAERDFKRALELNPNYPSAHQWYAYFMAFHKRFDEALEKIEVAHQLDPLSLPIVDSIGEFLYFARRNREAVEQFRKALELDPDFLASRINLGRAYEQLKMFGEAEEQFVKAREVTGESIDALAGIGHSYAMAKNKEGALEILGQLIELSKRRYVSPYDIALIHAALGDVDEAFRSLENAYDQCVEWMIYTNVDPRLDPLRGDARFGELLERLGFRPTARLK